MLLANVPSVNGSIEKHGQEHFCIHFEDENVPGQIPENVHAHSLGFVTGLVPGHVASVKGSTE